MSLIQFSRIMWARRMIVFVALFSCLLGAYFVVLVVPPRWEAHARVLLNLLKPDPVTGEVMVGSAPLTYVASQVELIEDYSVAGLVVDRSGWLRDPNYIASYRSRSRTDSRTFRRWLAQLITDHTTADVVRGSNILEIAYTSDSAENARNVAEAMRTAYLDTSLSLRRAEASRNADWFARRANEAKAALNSAEADEANYERAENIYMATDTLDTDSARLAQLATQNGGSEGEANDGLSSAGAQIAEVNAEIAQLTPSLGPNHPQLRALRAKRSSLLSLATREHSGGSNSRRGPTRTTELDELAALVSAKRDKLARLKELHARVDLDRELYVKTSTRAAELRQLAAVDDTGLTPLGPVTTPAAPTFPNIRQIFLGSGGLGLVIGILIALLVELLNRRIRGWEDLSSAIGVPVLAIISSSTRVT